MLAVFQRNKKEVEWLVRVLLYLSLLMPLVVSVRYFFPFVFPKAIFFEVLVELAFLLWLGLALVDKSFWPQCNWLLKTVAFWVAGIVVAGLAGINFYNSFWSKAERMEGIFWYLHLLAFFLVLMAVFRTSKEWQPLLRFNSLVALLVSGYALLGKYLPAALPLDLGQQDRLSGSFGNPAFLATYFVVVLFLNLYLFFAEKEKEKKLIWLFLVGLSGLMIVMSGTRGAYVGTAAGLFVFGTLGIFSGSRQQRKRAAGILLVLFFAGVSFFALRGFWQNIAPAFSSRIYSIWQIPTQRLLVWQLGLEAFQERPVFGWGLENFVTAYEQYFNPEIFRYEVAVFDRPHNKLVETAVTTGGLGLLAYLSVFGALTFFLLKRFRQALMHDQTQRALLLAVVAGLWAAYFVQNLVLFEMPTSALVLFFSLAFTVWLLFAPESLGQPAPLRQAKTGDEEKTRFKLKPEWRSGMYLFGVGLVVIGFYFGVAQPIRASTRLIKSISYLQSPNVSGFLESGESFYRQAREANSFLNREISMQVSRQLRALALYPQVLNNSQYQSFLREVSADLMNQTNRYQDDYDLLVEIANLSLILEARVGQAVEFKTLDLAARAAALAPKRFEAYETAFTYFLLTGQQASARQEMDKLFRLHDRVGVIWFYQAIYEARWGTTEAVLEAFYKAKTNGYSVHRASEQENLLNAFLANDNPQGALRYLDEFLKENLLFTERIKFQLIKIEILYNTGQRTAASGVLQEVLSSVDASQRQGLLNYLRSRGVELEM